MSVETQLSITAGDASYPIYLERSFETLPGRLMESLPLYHRIAIITDSHVAPLYLETVAEQLKKTGAIVSFLVLPAGEENKHLGNIETVYSFLIEHSFDRKDLLAALGGGVIGDMTGFAAATYLRGIDFIQIPTTLLSQVDSSIGGKTGVDFQSYKNMVGAFKQPKMVFMNISTLKTLPERQFSTGMAEIIKHGCIRNRDYLLFLENHHSEILAQDPDALISMIYESLLVKKNVVEEDPTEKGIRAILNFGHTLGHALEKDTDFSITHGEGVALGCAGALYLSRKRGWITEEEQSFCEQLFRSYGLPVRYTGFSVEQVLENSRHDKKMAGDHIRFILLDKIGNAVIDHQVTRTEMEEALQYIRGEREN